MDNFENLYKILVDLGANVEIHFETLEGGEISITNKQGDDIVSEFDRKGDLEDVVVLRDDWVT